MKSPKKNSIFLILFFTAIAIIFSNCNTTKKIDIEKNDSVYVNKKDFFEIKKNDSASLKKTEKSNEQNATWLKETITLQPIISSSDTVINKYYTAYITKESGTTNFKQREKTTDSLIIYKYDSTSQNNYDSIKVILNKMSKESKTKVLSLWQIIGIAVGCSLIIFIILKIKN